MTSAVTDKGRSNAGVIQTYFSEGVHGRKVTLDELKALAKPAREELGALAAIELGLTRGDDGKYR